MNLSNVKKKMKFFVFLIYFVYYCSMTKEDCLHQDAWDYNGYKAGVGNWFKTLGVKIMLLNQNICRSCAVGNVCNIYIHPDLEGVLALTLRYDKRNSMYSDIYKVYIDEKYDPNCLFVVNENRYILNMGLREDYNYDADDREEEMYDGFLGAIDEESKKYIVKTFDMATEDEIEKYRKSFNGYIEILNYE